MKHQRAYLYRCYPTPSQRQPLARTFGCARFVYNWALRLRSDAYRERGEHPFYRDTSVALTRLKRQEATSWLNDVSSVPTQQSLRHLDTAFRNFFEGRAKYPTFKKKRGRQSAEYTTSAFKWDGNERFFTKDEKRLATLQRRHAKKQKGGKNREKARRKVAKLHARIADRRRDFQHKLATRIIRENQVVCVESLAVKNMMQNHCLAQAIADVGWGELIRQLDYKARWYGRTLVSIDRFAPSSKQCHGCGYLLDDLDLEVREWTCPNCGLVHDRDLNAALNIKAAGLAVFACGEPVRPNLHGTREGTTQRSRKTHLAKGGLPLPLGRWEDAKG